MKRILLPIGDNDLKATNGRLLHIARVLGQDGFHVEVMTYSREVFAFAGKQLKGSVNVTLTVTRSQGFPVQHRPALIETFIKLMNHVKIPGSDLEIFKITAFDDFSGHIVDFSFPDIDITLYSSILMPLPTTDGPPPPIADIFYSTICFLAKSENIPIVGLQLYPVVQIPPLHIKTIDYIIIKAEWEIKVLEEQNFDLNRIFVLSHEKDNYLISTIEDSYLNLVYKADISISKKEIAILIINHHKLRFCIKDVLDVVGPLDVPKTVFFLKRKFVVRELNEDDIINELFMDSIKAVKGRSFLMEPDTKGNLIMMSDIIISPTYLSTLEFASKYDKLSLVYNPLYEKMDDKRGVEFVNNKESLRKRIMDYYRYKLSLTSFSDIAGELSKSN